MAARRKEGSKTARWAVNCLLKNLDLDRINILASWLLESQAAASAATLAAPAALSAHFGGVSGNQIITKLTAFSRL